VPGIETIPERMPGLTEAGNPSITKLTKGLRNSYYLELICGHALMTVRKALAVAPGLQMVRVAVARRAAPDAYGTRALDCLMSALFTRARLEGVRWQSADAAQIVRDASAELRLRLSASREPLSLDLSGEPDLAALLRAAAGAEGGRRTGEDGLPAAGQTAPVQGAGLVPAQGPRPEPALTVPPPPPGPPYPARATARRNKGPLKVAGIVAGGLVMLLIIIAALGSGKSPRPAGNISIAATTTTPAVTATPTRTPAPHAKTVTKRAFDP
jgi:hypothetical protein